MRLSAISVLEILGAHRISVRSLKQLLRLLESPRGMASLPPKTCHRLLQAIRNMIHKMPHQNSSFDGILSGLYLPVVKRWPSKTPLSAYGYRRLHRGLQRQALLNFRAPPSRGLELFLDGQTLVLRIPGAMSRSSKSAFVEPA